MEFFTFGLGQEVKETSKEILGGKGAGLVSMDKLGVPVPPGFIIPTSIWTQYNSAPKGTMKSIAKVLPQYLTQLEKHFGYAPLLSVRSGARVSCPGMMDTILNVGLDDSNDAFWANKLGQKCYEDSMHRLITMYGSVVKGIDRAELEKGTWEEARRIHKNHTGELFPDAKEQLLGSIEAVFKSWNNERAKVYRKLHNIPAEWGTAVVVQAMVFGNLNEQSGTGVLFTRNPDTGERKVTGEFLVNAQGEDVVAGIRTPMPLDEMAKWNSQVYVDLHEKVEMLESVNKDMQDVEFTIQDGKLYLLQTRNGKRSATAAVRIAVEMVEEGLLTQLEAVKRVTPKQLDLAQIPVIDPSFDTPPMFQGIGACSGVVTGKPVYSAQDAINCKEPCILITKETTPDDIAGMLASVGVITMEGGLTSHAAVVARGENKPCITGVGEDVGLFQAHGGVVSMDGATGRVWLEKVPVVDGVKSGGQVDAFKKMLPSATNTVPVITEVPEQEMEAALLYLGVKMLDTGDVVDLIANCAVRVKKLYVDLTSSDREMEFFSICGGSPAQLVVSELAKLVATFSQTGKEQFTRRVTLVGNVDPMGFKILGSCKDLRSLILSKEEVGVEGFEGSDEAVEWVLQRKMAEGLSFVSLGSTKVGCKSILGIEQALAEVQ